MSSVSLIINSINRGVLSPVYLFYGAEPFLINQAVDALYRYLVPEGIGDFNYEKLDGSLVSPAQVVDSAGILPVFAEKRLVVVNHVPWFSAVKGEEASQDHNIDYLLSYLNNPSPTTCLVLVAGEKIDSRRKIVKAAQKTGQLIEFAPLKGGDLSKWIGERFRGYGKKVERSVIEYLSVAVGSNLSLLVGEIDKVTSFVGTSANVSLADVSKTVSKSSILSVFQVVDAVGNREASNAVSLIREIIKTGESEIKIMSLLARQLRIMLRAKIMTGNGIRESEIANELNIHPFVVRKGLEEARNFSPEELVRGLEILLDADVALKTGKGEPLALLETAVLKMCHRTKF